MPLIGPISSGFVDLSASPVLLHTQITPAGIVDNQNFGSVFLINNNATYAVLLLSRSAGPTSPLNVVLDGAPGTFFNLQVATPRAISCSGFFNVQIFNVSDLFSLEVDNTGNPNPVTITVNLVGYLK